MVAASLVGVVVALPSLLPILPVSDVRVLPAEPPRKRRRSLAERPGIDELASRLERLGNETRIHAPNILTSRSVRACSKSHVARIEQSQSAPVTNQLVR